MDLSNERNKRLREELVRLLELKGIKNKSALKAIGSVSREFFISEEFSENAYEDIALPIEYSQTISQPYTVAYMTETLKVKEGDKVLEVGTGSGYQAAVLAEMGAKVFSIERIPELLDFARRKLKILGYEVNTKYGDGSLGWQEEAPFDAIIVTAAAPDVPKNLINQLKIGGRLIIPIGDKKSQTMHLYEKQELDLIKDQVMDQFRFVPLIGKQGWAEE